MPTDNTSCEDYRPVMRTRNGLVKAAKITGVVAALIAALVSLGILPWATAVNLTSLTSSVEIRLDRIDKRLDDLHLLFFPRGRR